MQTCLFFSFLARQPPRPSLTLLTVPLPGSCQDLQIRLASHPLYASLPLFPRSEWKPGHQPSYLTCRTWHMGPRWAPKPLRLPLHISCRAPGAAAFLLRGMSGCPGPLLGLPLLWTLASLATWLLASTGPGLWQRCSGFRVSCSMSCGCSRADFHSLLWKLLFTISAPKKQRKKELSCKGE